MIQITTHSQEAVLQNEQSTNFGQGGRGKSSYKSKNIVFQTFIFTLIKIICMQTIFFNK